MSIIENNSNANQIIQFSKNYYESITNESFHNIQIFISDNFDEDVKLFIDTTGKPSANNANGLYIEANSLSSIPTILIKADLFNQDSYPYLGTILHELTHASDFEHFVSEYCNGNWLSLKENANFSIMRLWSEYHARIFEILHMRVLASILYPNDYNYDINTIKEEMKNYQLAYYNTEFNNKLAEQNITLVEIVTYCARFYVCQLYNPELSLSDNLPPSIYDYFPCIIYFYDALKSLQTYRDSSPYFSVLGSLLNNYL